MKRLPMKYVLFLMVLLFTALSVCDVQGQGKKEGRTPDRTIFGTKKEPKKVKTKDKKVKEPRAVRRAKKTQEKKEAKIKKDYNNYVADSRKRAYQIQTPEVQARMKQNQKDINTREKNHKKKSNSSTQRARKKYK